MSDNENKLVDVVTTNDEIGNDNDEPSKMQESSTERPEAASSGGDTLGDRQDNESGGGETFTMETVLDIIDGQNEEVDAFMGALQPGEEKKCTYEKGYVRRQALYSCLTCRPVPPAPTQDDCKWDDSSRAGICLQCSLNCHDNHDLVELYTKRAFRCDCGIASKFTTKCTLCPDKEATVNTENVYNQNFDGLYCTCHRPYPDNEKEDGAECNDNNESNVEDETMVQCVICEDWYHIQHLGGAEEPQNGYAEIICEQCVTKHEFLAYYADEDIPPATEETPSSNTEKCTKPLVKHAELEKRTRFMSQLAWRTRLCKCTACLAVYQSEGVAFLSDLDDSVAVYMEKGKTNTRAKEEQCTQELLGSMDRVQTIEFVSRYNEFKDKLKGFLKRCAEDKRVLKPSDIKEFFAGLENESKKRKLNQGGGGAPPRFCR